MKVLAINGSPRENGVCNAAIRVVASELEKQGVEVEIFQLGTKPIRGCIACGQCKVKGKCVFNDDCVNEVIEKVKDIDGIIFASPVYYSGIAGGMKSFMDRLFYAGGKNLKYKVGACIASCRRAGGVDVFHQLNNYLNLANIVITPSQYWNGVFGNTPEEFVEDKEGNQVMRVLGRNMAWLLKSIDNSKDVVELPYQEDRVGTNFIR